MLDTGLPGGCELAAGRIDAVRVVAHYSCDGETYGLVLRWPAGAAEATRQTEKFAIDVTTPDIPIELLDAVTESIRSAESSFRWLELEPDPTPRPTEAPSPRPTPRPTPDLVRWRASVERACAELRETASAGLPLAEDLPLDVPRGAIWTLLRPVYECLVIAQDSPVPCDRIEPLQRRNCRARWLFFHEARRADDATRWPAIMAAGLREDCLSEDRGGLESVCLQIERAVREQSPEACPSAAPAIRDTCIGIASSDPSRCPPDSPDCMELARRLRILIDGGGLERVAIEGTPRDRVHARAALGIPGACEPPAADFVRQCKAFVLKWAPDGAPER